MIRARSFILVTGLLVATLPLSASTRQRGLIASGKDFPTVGGDLANQRYSSLAEITRENVTRLGGAWMVRLKDASPPATCRARRWSSAA